MIAGTLKRETQRLFQFHFVEEDLTVQCLKIVLTKNIGWSCNSPIQYLSYSACELSWGPLCKLWMWSDKLFKLIDAIIETTSNILEEKNSTW